MRNSVTAILPTQWQQRLHRKRLAYERTFCDDQGEIHVEARRVIADLKRFCHIDSGGMVISPISRTVDPYASMYRAGLRDVYLRIIKMIHLEETEVHDERTDD